MDIEAVKILIGTGNGTVTRRSDVLSSERAMNSVLG